jgi:hypothetical protein
MATSSTTIAPPASTGWDPSPETIYRLSVEQYEAMVAAGVFTKRERSAGSPLPTGCLEKRGRARRAPPPGGMTTRTSYRPSAEER